MSIQKKAVLFFISFFFLTVYSQSVEKVNTPLFNATELEVLKNDSMNLRAEQLCILFDSLYPAKKGIIFNLLSEQEWLHIFDVQYGYALKNKNEALQFRLAYPLAVICHTTTKFTKGLPLFEYLYRNKNKLSSQKYALVLIKLEEEYRSLNHMREAMLIRNERIQRGFISTFWELYAECGLWQEALNDYLLFEENPPENGIRKMKYYWNLGDLLFNSGKTDSAEKYYRIGWKEANIFINNQENIQQYTKDNLLYWNGNFSGLIGKCYWKKKEFRKAIPYLNHDLSLSTDRYKIRSWAYLADCYLNLENLKQCKVCIDSVNRGMQGRTMKEVSLVFYKTVAGYYKAVQQMDAAYNSLLQFNAAKEEQSKSLEENQTAFLLARLEIQKRRNDLLNTRRDLLYSKTESKSQRQQLIILFIFLIASFIVLFLIIRINRQKTKSKIEIEKQNNLLKEKSEKIAKQNERNQLLLRELHHRVKNNLQVVYSLLNMQKRRVTDEETRKIFSGIQSRIQSMSFVHEHLCNTDKIELVEMKEYIFELIHYLQTANQKPNVSIEYELGPFKLDLETAISLGMILNEMISNAFKYAFNEEDRGVLKVKMELTEGCCEMTVSDNGPGFTVGQENKSGIGNNLIKTLCSQLKATYELKQSNGVTHTLKLKI